MNMPKRPDVPPVRRHTQTQLPLQNFNDMPVRLDFSEADERNRIPDSENSRETDHVSGTNYQFRHPRTAGRLIYAPKTVLI